MKKFILALLFSVLCVSCAFADELADYKKALTDARVHALSPTGWKATDLATLPSGGKVVVRTLTKYMPSAEAGGDTHIYSKLGEGVIDSSDATWVTTGTELKAYWASQKLTTANVQNETFRVLGMPTRTINPSSTHNIIYEFEIDSDINKIHRPTKDPSISRQPEQIGFDGQFQQPNNMSDTAFAGFRNYYRVWQLDAFKHDDPAQNYPWTQLGYTYRWGKGDGFAQIRGLSEFIVLAGTAVKVHALYTLQSYMYNEGAGGGNFDITGDSGAVDWILAGRQYQQTGDKIVIRQKGAVGGGNGILISSPGYTVTNDGTITVSSDKNIALLFSDDIGYIGYEKNKFVNSGTISSKNIAIKSTGANTELTFKGGELRGEIELGIGYDELIVEGATKFYLPILLDIDVSSSATSASNDLFPPIRGVETITLSAPMNIYLEPKVGTPESLVGKWIKLFDNNPTIHNLSDMMKIVNYDAEFDDEGNVLLKKYTPASGGGGGGGGGCNAGVGFIALLCVVPILAVKRK